MEGLIKQHVPLYLKYRPRSLNELVGQDAVKQTLLNAIDHNRLSHAFLFVGPRGTGKTSTARILAKSANCIKGPTTTPCQVCTSCVEIAAGTSPAVLEIDAASNNSVEDARGLIEKAPLVAPGGRCKLYIIDECHMLSREAFNALLKTLEEPPPNVIFVLATTEEHKVPSTIASRCQKLLFRLLNFEVIAEYLRKIAKSESLEIESSAIDIIARQARGGMRDALGILDQASLLSMPGKPVSTTDLLNLLGALPEEALFSLGSNILQSEGAPIVDCTERLLMEGREPAVIVSELAAHFLNLLRAIYNRDVSQSDGSSSGSVQPITGSGKYAQALSRQAKQLDPLELTQIIEQLDQLEQLCRRSTQPALQLEVGLLSICHRHHIPSLQGLANRVSELEQILAAGKRLSATSQKPSSPTSSQRSLSQSSSQLPSAAPPQTKDSKPPTTIAPEPKHTDVPITKASILTEQTARAPQRSAASTTRPTEIPPEPFWSDLLSTLEERHRPTWSLVSTHAFPIRVTEKELIIGVSKEQFQKMIEAKAEHIRGAARAIIGHLPTLHVRVTDSGPLKTPAIVSEPNEPEAPNSAKTRVPTPPQDAPSALKEAYKLFEGPGSRQIG